LPDSSSESVQNEIFNFAVYKFAAFLYTCLKKKKSNSI